VTISFRSLAAALVVAGGGVLAACGAAIGEEPKVAAREPVPPATAPARPFAGLPADFVISGDQQQGGWIRGKVPAGTVCLSLGGSPVPLAPDGSFFAAFDRDAGPRAALVARRSDGSVVTRDLTIAPRGWKIEHINAARRLGGPSAAFMPRRRPELARIGAARAKDTGASGWRQQFIWPVRGRISGMFGSQRVYRGEPGSYHSGLDIATGSSGTPFVAPADGVVILAAKEPFTLEGHLLMIDHGMGLNSAFLHCSALLVEEGDTVRQGQLIGRIGATGRATGPHLHWGMKWQSARIDPILLAGPMK